MLDLARSTSSTLVLEIWYCRCVQIIACGGQQNRILYFVYSAVVRCAGLVGEYSAVCASWAVCLLCASTRLCGGQDSKTIRSSSTPRTPPVSGTTSPRAAATCRWQRSQRSRRWQRRSGR